MASDQIQTLVLSWPSGPSGPGAQATLPSTSGGGGIGLILEEAQDVGVKERSSLAGAEVGTGLVPGVGRPGLRTGALDHVNPLLGDFDGTRGVHLRDACFRRSPHSHGWRTWS